MARVARNARNVRLAAIALMSGALLLFAFVPNALAHEAKISIDCDSVDVTFTDFANAANTATVTINGASNSVSWNGPNHSVSFPISPEEGDTTDVAVAWNTNGHQGSASSSETAEGCGPTPTPSPSESPSPSPSESPSPSPSESPSPSPSASPSPSPSASPSPSPSASPSPSPTVSPTVLPTTITGAGGGGGGADVGGAGGASEVSAGGQGQGGAAAQPEELAFTGPRDQVPVLAVIATLLFVTGLVLLRVARRLEVKA